MAFVDFTRAAAKVVRYAEEAGKEVGSGLRVIGESIMTDVKAARPGKGVPVDKGVLRATGRVEGPRGVGNAVVTLSFGGPAAPYALRQHETLAYRHDVGEARYLVRGVERFQSDGLSAGRKALKENIEKAARRVGRS